MGRSRRTSDHYTKRAKGEQFPARSVYKLEEIDRRVKLLKPGLKVLDLGAAPGSWTLYATKKIGQNGRVVAVDLNNLKVATPTTVTHIQSDVFEVDPAQLTAEIQNAGFHAVLSDMAPHTSGHTFVDQTRSFDLYSRALEIASAVLKPGGSFVGKIFFGEDFETARANTRAHFEKVRVIKPNSVRKESYEVYLVGLKFGG